MALIEADAINLRVMACAPLIDPVILPPIACAVTSESPTIPTHRWVLGIVRDSRADVRYIVSSKPSWVSTGGFLLDDSFLGENGGVDLDQYGVAQGRPLQLDFFVPTQFLPPGPLGPVAAA